MAPGRGRAGADLKWDALRASRTGRALLHTILAPPLSMVRSHHTLSVHRIKKNRPARSCLDCPLEGVHSPPLNTPFSLSTTASLRRPYAAHLVSPRAPASCWLLRIAQRRGLRFLPPKRTGLRELGADSRRARAQTPWLGLGLGDTAVERGTGDGGSSGSER
ncbi:hypothetical protein EXIGLDRAFT_26617 [Exidia glandulosa HHB12029]|uniref:Uncharacterized protein n=1 Tax=Exidia glandulosa HHB12029 TaxID=1314781 RepID=A0A165P7T4_EXIGL|nr:hypothetical protein EXIGLDRAFT_26617 [Exidia glandulosa HHB12029]